MAGGFNDVLESIVFMRACCGGVWVLPGAPWPWLENKEISLA